MTTPSLSSSNLDSALPSTSEALGLLLHRFIELSHKLDLSLPKVEYDESWGSECIVDVKPDENGLVQWQPVIRTPECIFSHMETALGVKFHPDIISFYSHYWSDGIVVSHNTGEMSLIQIWNAVGQTYQYSLELHTRNVYVDLAFLPLRWSLADGQGVLPNHTLAQRDQFVDW